MKREQSISKIRGGNFYHKSSLNSIEGELSIKQSDSSFFYLQQNYSSLKE